MVLVFGRVRMREPLLSLSLSRSCPADCDWKGFNWALSVYSPNHPDGACRGVLQDGRQIGQDLQTNTFTSFALQPQYVSPSGWSSLRIEWGQRWGRWPVIGGRSHCLLMEWERHSWLEWGLRSCSSFEMKSWCGGVLGIKEVARRSSKSFGVTRRMLRRGETTLWLELLQTFHINIKQLWQSISRDNTKMFYIGSLESKI